MKCSKSWSGRSLTGLGALALAACGAGTTDVPFTTLSDSAGVFIAQNGAVADAPVCTLAPDPVTTIGDRMGDPDHELYRVFGARRLSDGRVVVTNQGTHQLKFYDESGDHLYSVGREGEGPGEFKDNFLIWTVTGDTIWAGDYRPWRYHVYAPDGTWIRTVTPQPVLANPPRQAGMLDGGEALLGDARTVRENFTTPSPLDVRIHGADGVERTYLGAFPFGTWGTIGESNLGIYVLFDRGTRLTARGERIAMSQADDAEVRVLDRDGRLVGLIRWVEPDRTVTDADIERERERLAEPYADMDPNEARVRLEPFVSPDRPISPEFPALAEVQLGREGGVLVRRYARPRAEHREQWLIFDPSGALRCSLVVPDDFEMYDAGEGWVLGNLPGELDVETVVVMAIDPPQPPE